LWGFLAALLINQAVRRTRIIASMQRLGVTMIAAALVVPASTARLLTDSFHRMIGMSTLLGG
jgi:ABC-type Mn2+/Zn2+ transport system permease subunit